MTIITREELHSKFEVISGNIYHVSAAALDDKDDSKESWLHNPTLAKWLYGSAQEFLNEFKKAAREYLNHNSQETDEIAQYTFTLTTQVENLRKDLTARFSEDESLMGVIEA